MCEEERERQRKGVREKEMLVYIPPSEQEFPDELGQVGSFPKSDTHLNHIFPLRAILGFI